MKPTTKNVKRALADTIAKLAADIELVREKGGFPHDYSLGFANGLIFVMNRMSNRQMLFFDRKTSIGELPRPVVFQHQGEQDALDAAEFDAKVDDIIDAARTLTTGPCGDPEYGSPHLSNLTALIEALSAYDKFMEEKENESRMMEGNEAGGEEPTAMEQSPGSVTAEGTELHEDRPTKSGSPAPRPATGG